MKRALRNKTDSLWIGSSFLLPLTLWATGCTGQVQDPAAADAAPDAASTLDSAVEPDAAPDVVVAHDGGPANDSGCVPAGVWQAGDEGFTFAQLGGFTQAPAPDAGCSVVGSTYDYVAASKMLSQHLCNFDGPIENTVELTDLEARELVATLEAMRTSCPPYASCGADYPGQSLSVRAPGAAPVTYTGDFYAGCGDALTPPYIAYTAMQNLGDTLYHLVEGPAGASPDGGDAN